MTRSSHKKKEKDCQTQDWTCELQAWFTFQPIRNSSFPASESLHKPPIWTKCWTPERPEVRQRQAATLTSLTSTLPTKIINVVVPIVFSPKKNKQKTPKVHHSIQAMGRPGRRLPRHQRDLRRRSTPSVFAPSRGSCDTSLRYAAMPLCRYAAMPRMRWHGGEITIRLAWRIDHDTLMPFLFFASDALLVACISQEWWEMMRIDGWMLFLDLDLESDLSHSLNTKRSRVNPNFHTVLPHCSWGVQRLRMTRAQGELLLQTSLGLMDFETRRSNHRNTKARPEAQHEFLSPEQCRSFLLPFSKDACHHHHYCRLIFRNKMSGFFLKACLPENHGLQATEDEKPLTLQRIPILGQIVWARELTLRPPRDLGSNCFSRLGLSVGVSCHQPGNQGLRSTGVSLATMSAVRKSQRHQ